MTATLRLFTIEARRSIALWFVPLMALVACWYARDRMMAASVAIWRHSSTQIGETLIVIAPLMGGVATWAAGRDQRRGIGELLESTPRPVAQRTLASWGATVFWGVVAYAVVGAFVVAVSLRDEAWGSPSAAPVVIGLLTIVAASAIGYLVGSLIPSRFVTPLVPIGLVLAIGLLNSDWFLDDPVSFLSPWTFLDRQLFMNSESVFYTLPSLHLLPMSLWLAGLAGMALTGVVLSRRHAGAAWLALACSAAVATTGATLLLSAYEDGYLSGVPWEHADLVPYTPVCVERSITVCVHPAFKSEITQHANRIDLLIAPLLGLLGAPVRAEQLPYSNGVYADGTLAADPYGVETAALALVQQPVEPGPGWKLRYDLQPEQMAIAKWLALRVDAEAFEDWDVFVWWDAVDGPTRDPEYDNIDAAVVRFSALDPAQQREWLEANYADLRAGRLSLDDLP